MFTKPNMFFFCLCSFCGFLFQLQVSQAQSPLTQNVTAVEGGTVTLTCKVDQNDNTSLQWSNPAQQTLYFDDKKALRDNRIELVRSSWQELSINISEVALSDEGQYTCSLFTMPVKTSKAFLTVLGVPQTPVISGFKGPFNEGDLVELTCSTSGSKPAADIRWFKDEKEMKDIPSIKESNGKTFTVSSKMGLRVDRNDDGVAVSCTVDHVSLKASPQVATQVLNIQYMPSVKIDFSRNFAREGDELRLECRVTGNPTPEAVKWKKDGAELPDPDRMVVEGNMLIISALNKTDNGTYYCEASNLLGENTAEYILFVYDALSSAPPPTTASPSLPIATVTAPANLASRASVGAAVTRARALTTSTPVTTIAKDPSALAGQTGTDHAMIGGVVAVVVFVTLCLIIVLGRYLARHKGTYLTNEAKGAEDAPDADTAIINAEGSQANADEKKEYFI
ncbi:cell adhesion molecule 2b isoform X1 [Callorhinchus milii]|uniref:Cell adhesion molecule 2-like protein n=2 Tax=Callorhinchus milii TaxID=7868 RepID=V9KXB5_CALMI|nr:cell adhesion molecule 2b isoform X1 [Callorhinchus milii]|eukprot:gi/632970636/ref/XP_007901761.1/ PREDICTED: cell adhesion molecule 2 isoform X1 [Callorhinchus milii]